MKTADKITLKIAKEIISHESIVRQMYKDSVGISTWSVGITNASGHKVDRYKDNPQTMKHCIEVFVWLLENKYLPTVLKAFKGYPLTEAQLGAALSFHWHTGSIRKASWVEAFKDGKIEIAKQKFMLWNKPKSIIPRRKKEFELLFNGKWSGHDPKEITEVTRKYTPKWSSMKSVNIDAELEACFSVRPIKNYEPEVNTSIPHDYSLITRVIGLLVKLLKGLKNV